MSTAFKCYCIHYVILDVPHTKEVFSFSPILIRNFLEYKKHKSTTRLMQQSCDLLLDGRWSHHEARGTEGWYISLKFTLLMPLLYSFHSIIKHDPFEIGGKYRLVPFSAVHDGCLLWSSSGQGSKFTLDHRLGAIDFSVGQVNSWPKTSHKVNSASLETKKIMFKFWV